MLPSLTVTTDLEAAKFALFVQCQIDSWKKDIYDKGLDRVLEYAGSVIDALQAAKDGLRTDSISDLFDLRDQRESDLRIVLASFARNLAVVSVLTENEEDEELFGSDVLGNSIVGSLLQLALVEKAADRELALYAGLTRLKLVGFCIFLIQVIKTRVSSEEELRQLLMEEPYD